MENNHKISKYIYIYIALVPLYCVSLVVSNIISNRTFEVLGIMLPSAVIVFPIVYIINDVLTECYGFKLASRAIWTAFGLNLMAVIFFNIAINLPSQIDYSSYNIVLGNTVRPLVASLAAYLFGSFANAKVMDVLRKNKSLMLRCVLSTLIGETLDAAIFISIMFIGVMELHIVLTMIASQALVKTAYEIVVYPVTKRVINSIKNLDG